MPLHSRIGLPGSLEPRHDWTVSQDTLVHDARAGEIEKVKPALMQYGDVPNACATLESGTVEDDPLERYLQVTPSDHKDAKRYRTGTRILSRLQFYRSIWDKCAWTIHHGQSVMVIGDPNTARRPINKLIDPVYRRLVRGIRGAFQTEEQKKRTKEFVIKMQASAEAHLGHRLPQSFEISSLVTAPEYRERGYASALVRVATSSADAQGVPTWLASSNTVNRGFYQYLGFQIVDTFYLGGENPSWKEQPIAIDIMVREWKAEDAHRVEQV